MERTLGTQETYSQDICYSTPFLLQELSCTTPTLFGQENKCMNKKHLQLMKANILALVTVLKVFIWKLMKLLLHPFSVFYYFFSRISTLNHFYFEFHHNFSWLTFRLQNRHLVCFRLGKILYKVMCTIPF